MSQRKDELELENVPILSEKRPRRTAWSKETKKARILGEKEAKTKTKTKAKRQKCSNFGRKRGHAGLRSVVAVRTRESLLACCTFVLFSKGRRAVLFSKQATTATERITVGERGPVDIVEAAAAGGHVESML